MLEELEKNFVVRKYSLKNFGKHKQGLRNWEKISKPRNMD
jgi:hypothetical protein